MRFPMVPCVAFLLLGGGASSAATTDTIFIRGVVEPKPPKIDPIVMDILAPFQPIELAQEEDESIETPRAPSRFFPPPAPVKIGRAHV